MRGWCGEPHEIAGDERRIIGHDAAVAVGVAARRRAVRHRKQPHHTLHHGGRVVDLDRIGDPTGLGRGEYVVARHIGRELEEPCGIGSATLAAGTGERQVHTRNGCPRAHIADPAGQGDPRGRETAMMDDSRRLAAVKVKGAQGKIGVGRGRADDGKAQIEQDAASRQF